MRPSTRHRMRDCCFESKAHDLELAIKLYRRQTALNKANYLQERCEQRQRHQREKCKLKVEIVRLELFLAVEVTTALADAAREKEVDNGAA